MNNNDFIIVIIKNVNNLYNKCSVICIELLIYKSCNPIISKGLVNVMHWIFKFACLVGTTTTMTLICIININPDAEILIKKFIRKWLKKNFWNIQKIKYIITAKFEKIEMRVANIIINTILIYYFIILLYFKIYISRQIFT